MTDIKYFFQFLFIIILFLIFKLLGLKYSSILSSKIFKTLGPFFRSNDISHSNLSKAFPHLDKNERKKIINKMWENYGKIFAEYLFLKDFRLSKNFSKRIIIENENEINLIKEEAKPVIFISGHFNNFELMAMYIEKSGIDLAAIYRPLNNKFLNPIMENIRKNYICKKQIKKGIAGTKDLLKYFKNGNSVALMIDQRVSEGIHSEFFNQKALTTTIPAQFVKKFNAKIVPVYIERIGENRFKIKFYKSIKFSSNDTLESITLSLNILLEEMIKKNPEQWIWSHNRWK
tara:strand:+ start:164 stop:1027 length:864 start_codon:yes stop_codon:yes gene_type:complete